nr:3-methyl-2-oxobutanoate hydroxymethyltransferase [Fervidicoccus fontis]
MDEKITMRKFIKKKELKEKIVMITAYDTPFARIADKAGVDSILVGDSLAMVVLGMENTINVSLRTMIDHVKAVARAKPRALIVGDMPFMSYEVSSKQALKNASLMIKGGAEAVKLEGGEEIIEQVKSLVRAGIPVMGHIGLTPQRFLRLGGYRMIGKKPFEEEQLLRDAEALQEAGVFSIVVEYTLSEVARKITEKLSIPTICIGSGPYCDGQVLVLHDLLGLTEKPPSFAKKYADLSKIAEEAISKYASEVRNGIFPGKEHYT